MIDGGEQCDTAIDTSPCVGRARCRPDCQCPGNSCHDLPESAVCDDLDNCTDADACHARICAGEAKCRITLPDESPVPPKQPTVQLLIDATDEGVAGARCKARLFEAIPRANARASEPADPNSDPLPDVGNGRRLSSVRAGRIGSSGRLTLDIRLNKVAKRLFKKDPALQRIDALAEVEIKQKNGRKRLLRQLITLVRPR